MDRFTADQCLAQVTNWKKEGIETSIILKRLLEQNIPEDMAQQAIQEWKELRTSRKRGIGVMCCGIGGGLLILSFLISLILFNTQHNFNFFLYSFTFLGVSVLLKGMVDLLGW